TGAKIRKALESYTPTYLRFVWTLSATVLVLCYALWAYDRGSDPTQPSGSAIWLQISIVPFTIAVLRYAVDVDAAQAGEPEDIALGARVLLVRAALWVLAGGGGGFLVPALARPGARPVAAGTAAGREGRLPGKRASVVFWGGVVAVVAVFLAGAWQRRSIADV